MIENEKFITNNLAVGYNGKILIDDININLEKGKILVLIGANGSGKSTILKSITKNIKTIKGSVFIDKDNIENISNEDFAKKTAIVFTERLKTEFMTCIDVVEMGRYPYTGRFGILSENDKEKVSNALKLVNVEDIKDKDFTKISDGQRQRVLLARAICQETSLIVLDEPTSFLDIHYKVEFLNMIKGLAKEKEVTIILSMHEIDLAKKVADYVVGIKDGKVACYGKPEEIFTKKIVSNLFNLDNDSYNYIFGNDKNMKACEKSSGKLSEKSNEKPEYVLPNEIETRSFEIIENELNEKNIILPKEEKLIIMRAIHTSADFEYVDTLKFSEDAVKKAKELIKSGADIVTDTNMAYSGISKKTLAKFGGKVHCFMADEDVANEAKKRNTTRATISMEKAINIKKNVIFVVGNAPTALISLHEMYEKGIFKPAFIIGVPVGFVNVVAAKELIMQTDIPFIINKGRKGGSNIAAAICNALLYNM